MIDDHFPAQLRCRTRPRRHVDACSTPASTSRCGRCATRILRDVPRRDQEHLDGRGGRLLDDLVDLRCKLTPAERHLISRLVAFFATGDSIVANNLVLNLYKHINAPEARLYLSRQLFEEALHVQFYLTLLDTYIPDHARARTQAFAAVENIPSIQRKAEFCFQLDRLDLRARRARDRGGPASSSCST